MSTKVKVPALPDCDIHKEQGLRVKARYDAKTIWGPWAYMCATCMKLYGPPQLGTGFGQELFTEEEK